MALIITLIGVPLAQALGVEPPTDGVVTFMIGYAILWDWLSK